MAKSASKPSFISPFVSDSSKRSAGPFAVYCATLVYTEPRPPYGFQLYTVTQDDLKKE